MISTIVRAASCAAILAVSTMAAEAATYNMSYEDSNGGLLTAKIKGNLQADGDTVFVTAVLNSAFNGVAGPMLAFVDSATNRLLGGGAPAQLSLTGTNNDMFTCTSAVCMDGFAFIPKPIFPVEVFASGPSYGPSFEGYDAAKFSMAAVPLPAGGLLLLTAFGGLAALRRKRAA